MNKTWIVAQREFNSRVRKKTFLLTTILLPLLIFVFYAAMIYFSVKGNDDLTIAVADNANVFNGKLDSTGDVKFTFVKDTDTATLNKQLDSKKYSGYMFIPADYKVLAGDTVHIYYGKTIGMISQEKIKDKVNDQLEKKRFQALNIPQEQLDSARRSSKVTFQPMKAGKGEKNRTGISYAVGMISGFLIYIILFIYGTMVMRGVMEEKVNRIAEVIISSVKPFQLMMGKIIGIGAVGLLQFIIWIVLVGTIRLVVMPMITNGADTSSLQAVPGAGAMTQAPAAGAAFANVMAQINFPFILSCFIFYFLGGYLLYSSLFAAVGSAVNEDPQDAQSLMLPITLPIIFAIVIMTKAVNDPNSSLAVFGSLFPLTSPIVMMARIAYGVPEGVSVLQLVLSMVFLVAGFLGTTWLAGKIYRTGILMYGKKPTWKEMFKWAFRKS
jgi:ABC-2 type transport system permease protein